MANIITSLFKNGTGLFGSREKSQHAEKFQLLTQQLSQEIKGVGVYYDIKLSDYPSGKAFTSLTPEEAIECLMYCLTLFVSARAGKEKDYSHTWTDDMRAQNAIIRGILRRKLPFDTISLSQLLTELLRDKKLFTYTYPGSSIMSAIERCIAQHGLTDALSELILKFGQHILNHGHATVDERRLEARARSIVAQANGNLTIPVNSGEAWSDKALSDLNAIPPDATEPWVALLLHCQATKPARPTKKWLKVASEKIKAIGEDTFRQYCIQWFRLVDKPKTVEVSRRHNWEPDPNLLLDDSNADIIKGLVWCCSLQENAEIARELGRLGVVVFKKIPGYGAKSVRVGNAVIYALAAMPGKPGLYQLAVLKVKVKYRQALSMMEKSLIESAQREGLTMDELAEMGVPAFGLESVGYGEELLGEHTALVEVNGFHNVELNWRKSDGKVQKSVPANVKEHYAQELKELKGNIKDIKSMLSVQKQRLEQLFLRELSWDFQTWQERYLNHPIVGVFARKLIWCIESNTKKTLVIFNGTHLESVDGKEINIDLADDKVSLWHPIESSVSDIKAWRERLIEIELTQPFKQAHREVYLLTEAEVTTNLYSNRFASHLIKQHQFNALAAARGWRYTLQGCWDGGCDEIATLELNKFNLYAEFWVHGIGEYGGDTSESGIFLYVSTDQVRFYHQKPELAQINEENIVEQRPVPLEQIPPLVLSEVFRDVDLYVGVCSVGNDPEWSDGGSENRYRDYWHSFSFGQLSASAITRKEILENLIPKLQFGDKCKFVDRFLVVEGDRRIYKIHLGSGNILMEPNNQYLCIVPDSKKKQQNVFLPFEGDNTLSIILSKAALLANDKKIKDRTINSQINSH